MAKNKEMTFDDIDKIISKEFDELIDLSKVDTKVKTWFDIGVYALNYICSKNLFGGIPVGRVSSIDGLTGTGKSLLVSSIMKDPKVDYIFIVETEGGGNSAELLEFAGVDLKKVRRIKANTFGNYRITKSNSKIEAVNDDKFPKTRDTEKYIYKEGATRIIKRLINTIEFNKIDKNILVIMDSLGNISSVREFSGTPDMGAKPKSINEFFRAFDLAFERTDIAFVFTNKLYTNIGNIYDPWKVVGGVAVEYNASLSMRLFDTSLTDDKSDTEIKDEKERRKSALGSSIKTVRAKIMKSRFGTEFRQIPFIIDFAIGPSKFSGLFTLCKDFGIFEKHGAKYSFKGSHRTPFFRKDFIQLITRSNVEDMVMPNKEIAEKETLSYIQGKLEEAEERIKAEKTREQLDVEDLVGKEDFEKAAEVVKEIAENEEFHDMKKEMVRDLEK